MSESRNQSLLKLHRVQRLIQRQNLFLSTAPNSNLSLLESHVLLETDARHGVAIGKLSELLNYDQGNLSRVIDNLESRGLIASYRDSANKRIRLLKISGRSTGILKAIDDYADDQINRSFGSLSKSEQSAIFELYRNFAGYLPSFDAKPRKDEHPLRCLQRGVTRSLGLLGNSAFGSGLPSTHFQVLALLNDIQVPLSAKAIVEILAVKPAALSAILKSFSDRNLLQRNVDPSDKRHISVTLNSKGIEAFEKLESKALAFLSNVLHSLSSTRLEACTIALTRYMESGSSSGNRSGIRITLHRGEEKVLRAFIIRNLVRLKLEEEAPETLCGRNSMTFVALSGATRVAAIHYHKKGSSLELNCVAWAPDFDHSALIHAILASTMKHLERLQLPVFTTLSSRVLQLAPNGDSSRDFLILPVETS